MKNLQNKNKGWRYEPDRHGLSSKGIKTKAPVMMMGEFERGIIKDLEEKVENSDIEPEVILTTIPHIESIHMGFAEDSEANLDDLGALEDIMSDYAKDNNMNIRYMLSDGIIGYIIY